MAGVIYSGEEGEAFIGELRMVNRGSEGEY
jgi:hypothetical protein